MIFTPTTHEKTIQYVGYCELCAEFNPASKESKTLLTHEDDVLRQDVCLVCAQDLISAEMLCATAGIVSPKGSQIDEGEARERGNP